MLKNRISQKILDFLQIFLFFEKRFFWENFNIPTNNIISVEAAKVLQYLL
jgi:hypothetical protein